MTAAFVVRIVVVASGKVYVFVVDVAPVNAINVLPVPPLAAGKVPVTPVERGKPVAFVSVRELGVPKAGVTSVGLVDNTRLPDPVDVVTPVPPAVTPKTPETLNCELPIAILWACDII